jgi:hypothetical protein
VLLSRKERTPICDEENDALFFGLKTWIVYVLIPTGFVVKREQFNALISSLGAEKHGETMRFSCLKFLH